MAYIGSKPANKPVVASDLDPTVITGQTALATSPASTDEFLISDAGVLKRLDASLIGGTNTPAFSASGDDQSISNGTSTKVAFNTEDFDTDGNYDHSTNYRFTPTTAGKYFLMANIRCRRTTDFNDMNVSIFKNGSSVAFQNNSSFHNESQLVTTIQAANGSSDYFEVFTSQSSGETDSEMNIFEFSGFRLIS